MNSYRSNLAGVVGSSFGIGQATIDSSGDMLAITVGNGDPIYVRQDGTFGVETSSSGTPPSTLTNGSYYLVGALATGAWVGKEDKIALVYANNWVFISPFVGCRLHSTETGFNYTYTGSWVTDPIDPSAVRAATAAANDSNVFTDVYRSKLDSMQDDILAMAIVLG